MKKLSFLMALIICLGCVLLAACGGDETETTDTELVAESTTEAPESTEETTDDDDNGGNGGNGGNEDNGGNGGNGGNEVVIGDVDAAKDAYANDIYEGVTPEAIG